MKCWIWHCNLSGYLTPLLLCLIVRWEFRHAQHGVEGVQGGVPGHPIASHALRCLDPYRAPLKGLASCYPQQPAHYSSALAALSPSLPADQLTTSSYMTCQLYSCQQLHRCDFPLAVEHCDTSRQEHFVIGASQSKTAGVAAIQSPSTCTRPGKLFGVGT